METAPVATKLNFAGHFKSMVTASTVTNASLHMVNMSFELSHDIPSTKPNFVGLTTRRAFVLMVRVATLFTILMK